MRNPFLRRQRGGTVVTQPPSRPVISATGILSGYGQSLMGVLRNSTDGLAIQRLLSDGDNVFTVARAAANFAGIGDLLSVVSFAAGASNELALPPLTYTATVNPSITGPTREGEALTLTGAVWTPTPDEVETQLLRIVSGQPDVVVSTTLDPYVPIEADRMAQLRLRQRAREVGGTFGAWAQSALHGPIMPPAGVIQPLWNGFYATRDEGTTGNVYVAKTGSDANPGTEALPKLTIGAAMTAAVSGQTIRVRAGVYRETVTMKAGVTLARYGTDAVTISGQEQVAAGAWTACDATDDAYLGATVRASCYKVTLPLTAFPQSNPRAAFVHEDGVALPQAAYRLPDPQFPINDAPSDWLLPDVAVLSGTAITGYRLAEITSAMTPAQIVACEAKIMHYPNVSSRVPIASVGTGTDGGANTINLDTSGGPYPDAGAGATYRNRFYLINALPRMERGEWGYRIDGSNAVLYVRPLDPASIAAGKISHAARLGGVTLATGCRVRGIRTFGQASMSSGNGGAYGIATSGTSQKSNIQVENCLCENVWSSANHYGPLYLYNVVDALIRGFRVRNSFNGYGFMLNGGSGHNERIRVDDVVIENSGRAPFTMFDCEQVYLSRLRTIGDCGFASHSNKAAVYAGSDRVLVQNVIFSAGSGYATFQEASRVGWLTNYIPVSYLPGSSAGRALVDQNGTTDTPSALRGHTGRSFVIGNTLAPFGLEIDETDSTTLGSAEDPEVTFEVLSNLIHGAYYLNPYVTLSANNWFTAGTPRSIGGTDYATTHVATYVDALNGDSTYKVDAPFRSAQRRDVTAQIAEMKSWFDNTGVGGTAGRFFTDAEFDRDLVGSPMNWSQAPVGPLTDYGSVLPFAPSWPIRPTVSGTVQVGQTLTASMGYVVGSPYPVVARQWQRLSVAGVWEDIAGATGLTYTVQAADEGRPLRIKGTATNALGANTQASRRTAAVAAQASVVLPVVTDRYPADNAPEVPVGDNATLTFNKPMQLAATGTITRRRNVSGTWTDDAVIDLATTPGRAQVSVTGAEVTIDVASNLVEGSEYAFRISPGALTDLDGNAWAGIANDSDWNFVAVAAPPVQPPTQAQPAPVVAAPRWTETVDALGYTAANIAVQARPMLVLCYVRHSLTTGPDITLTIGGQVIPQIGKGVRANALVTAHFLKEPVANPSAAVTIAQGSGSNILSIAVEYYYLDGADDARAGTAAGVNTAPLAASITTTREHSLVVYAGARSSASSGTGLALSGATTLVAGSTELNGTAGGSGIMWTVAGYESAPAIGSQTATIDLVGSTTASSYTLLPIEVLASTETDAILVDQVVPTATVMLGSPITPIDARDCFEGRDLTFDLVSAPPGLSLVDGLAVEGTPTASGNVVLRATNANGSRTRTIPVVVNSTYIKWGGRAAGNTGRGGVPLPPGATAITNAGGTGLVVSNGMIVPSGTTVTAGTITFDNGATRVIEIVPDAVSVSTIDELESEMERTGAGAPVGGRDRILIRGHSLLNPTLTRKDITRSTSNEITGGWVIVTGHEGEARPRIGHITMYGALGEESTPTKFWFSFEDIDFWSPEVAGEYPAAANQRKTMLLGQARTEKVAVRRCRFLGNCRSDAYRDDLMAAIGSNEGSVRWEIEDCTFRDVGYGIQGTASCKIVGNDFRRCGLDMIISSVVGSIIAFNKFGDYRQMWDAHAITSLGYGAVTTINTDRLIGASSESPRIAVAPGSTGIFAPYIGQLFNASRISQTSHTIPINSTGGVAGVDNLVIYPSAWHSDTHQTITHRDGPLVPEDFTYGTGWDCICVGNHAWAGSSMVGWLGRLQGLFWENDFASRPKFLLAFNRITNSVNYAVMMANLGAGVWVNNVGLSPLPPGSTRPVLGPGGSHRMTRPQESLLYGNVGENVRSMEGVDSFYNVSSVEQAHAPTYFRDPRGGHDQTSDVTELNAAPAHAGTPIDPVGRGLVNYAARTWSLPDAVFGLRLDLPPTGAKTLTWSSLTAGADVIWRVSSNPSGVYTEAEIVAGTHADFVAGGTLASTATHLTGRQSVTLPAGLAGAGYRAWAIARRAGVAVQPVIQSPVEGVRVVDPVMQPVALGGKFVGADCVPEFGTTGAQRLMLSMTMRFPSALPSTGRVLFSTARVRGAVGVDDRLALVELTVGSQTNRQLTLTVRSPDNVVLLTATLSANQITLNEWQTILLSVDTGGGIGAEVVRGYRLGETGGWSTLTFSTTTWAAADVTDRTIRPARYWSVGNRQSNQSTAIASFELGEVWYSHDSALDLSVPTNRDLFRPWLLRGASGAIGGITPHVYLRGGPNDIAVNRGTGGQGLRVGEFTAGASMAALLDAA